MRNTKIFCFILVFLLGFACTEKQNSVVEDPKLDSLAVSDTSQLQYIVSGNNDNEDVYKIIQSIPHSLEAIAVIPLSGHQYLNFVLPASEKYKKADDLHKSVNLGMLTASLGYAAAHKEFKDFGKILQHIEIVKADLGLPKHIEDETLKTILNEEKVEIATLDSILQLSTLNYDRSNYELTGLDKEHLSVAILVGAWLEYSYLQILAYKQTKNKDVKIKILEQKIIVELLLRVINHCKEKPANILQSMSDVQKAYAPVEVNDCDGLPKMKIVEGEIIIDEPCELIAKDIAEDDFKKIEQAVFMMHKKWKI